MLSCIQLTYTYIHTYIHTYMHTCIHAYMHTSPQMPDREAPTSEAEGGGYVLEVQEKTEPAWGPSQFMALCLYLLQGIR